MNVSGKARRRMENFEDLNIKIIKNMKKINENTPQNAENFPAPSAPDCVLIRGVDLKLGCNLK